LFPDKDVKLHLGHIIPFINEKSDKKYTENDFITLCSICNEGEKANIINKTDKIKMLMEQMKRIEEEIYKLTLQS